MNDLMITASTVRIAITTGEALSNGALEDDQNLLETDDFAMRLDQAEREISRLENLLRDRDDELDLLRENLADRPGAEEMATIGSAIRKRDWELVCDLLHRLGVEGF